MQRRNVFRRQFHAQIAARHHQRVRQGDNIVQMLDGRRFLDLRQNPRPPSDEFTRFGHILRALHEGQRDPIDPQLQRKGQIVAVFFGQGREIDDGMGHIHALAVR